MRLLLVEDSPRLQATIALGLRKAGYAVDVSGDGEDALWRARDGSYDLVILDVMLPKLDGLTVLRKLRAAGSAAHVLMLTVKDHVNDRVAGLRAGADDYLAKPFAFDELLARVEALVRRRYEKKNPVVRIGELELNTTARLVSCHGEVMALTPREYRLLEFLAQRAGEVVSRAEIEEHIYSDEKDLFSNAVESAISVLRRKLDAADCGPLIHTRRGMGYVLQAA
ncbi:MAG TPA: response regulator transcription factor [Methylomirabilota bacterium]|nr:response regulator transcription factor [Methylomirabilota bacterium]